MTTADDRSGPLRRRWPQLVFGLAAFWSVTMAALGTAWTFGAPGYPFGPAPADRMSGSILEGAPVSVIGPALTVLGMAGGVAGMIMITARGRRLRVPLLIFGALTAVLGIVVVPDYTVLALLAMWPVIMIFAFTGVPGPQDGVGDIIYWHRGFLLIVFVGGLLWATATLAWHRLSAGRCVGCGRNDGPLPPWTEPAAALRVGRVAVWVSVLSMVPYEITRIAWFLGVPIGITDEFHAMMAGTPGMLELGAGLAVLSIGGAVLTHGLVRRWGEVFWGWIPRLHGRSIPSWLAIVPASLVVLALPGAGMMNLTLGLDLQNWAVTGPGLLWFGWAGGLGVATFAYHLRRRHTCRRCGRGRAEPRSIADLDGNLDGTGETVRSR